jgi:hypothetical protein
MALTDLDPQALVEEVVASSAPRPGQGIELASQIDEGVPSSPPGRSGAPAPNPVNLLGTQST